MCLGRVMLRDHGLPHTSTANRRALMLAFVQGFFLSSARILWLDGAWCFISFSAVSEGWRKQARNESFK